MDFHIRRSLVVGVMSALALIAHPSVDAQSDDYRAIQGMLNELGLAAGPEDGQWGPASRRAMGAFQASKGLPATGTPDPATLAALRAQLTLPAVCSIGLELDPGQGCDVPGAGAFSVRADGCVDETPSFPDGTFRLSIGQMSSTSSGGKSQSCISGHLGIGPFRASKISGTSRWRIDALPGATSGSVEEASQELQRAKETRESLFTAIIAGDPAGVMQAIENGADVNELVDGSDLKGASALLVAAAGGNVEIVRLLVDAGADVNHALPEHPLSGKDSGGASVLSVAVNKESVEIVRLLVDAGADVNYVLPGKFLGPGSRGSTVLLKAVGLGNEQIVRLLVDAGANVNYVLPEQHMRSKSTSGISALLLAVGQEQAEIVRLLVDAGADVNYVLPKESSDMLAGGSGPAGTSALLTAVSRGNAEIVLLLVNAGADVNYVFPAYDFSKNSGVSALIFAAAKGDEEIVRLLIEARANVSYQIPESARPARTAGLTALGVARAQKHKRIVKLLRKAGARR